MQIQVVKAVLCYHSTETKFRATAGPGAQKIQPGETELSFSIAQGLPIFIARRPSGFARAQAESALPSQGRSRLGHVGKWLPTAIRLSMKQHK